MQSVRSGRFWASSFAVVLAVTALAVLPSFGGSAVPSGPNPPLGVHLSYLDNPSTAVLTWHTSSAATSRADWGTAVGGPYPFRAAGTDYASPGGSFLHTVTLTGLTPGTRYYYRVGDATMASSYGEASFRAALVGGSTETFSFAASGDWSNSSSTAATSNGIRAANPELVLPLGDLYYSSSEADVKGVFEKWQAFGQGSFVQTVVGNHEYPGDIRNTPTGVHCAFVNLPGNERTYSFKFGNTLFLAIDWGWDAGNTADGVDASGPPCGGTAGTNAIRSWLDARLAAANLDHDITWKVVLQHFQCYDMTTQVYTLMCPDGTRTLDQMEDIMNNRGVDLVLYGHDHTYGRTHPVRFHSTIQTGSSYDTPGAPIYFDLGTGGAAGTAICRTDSWVAACRAPTPTAGFGHFRVSPTTIQYEFVENTAGVLDPMTLTKRPSTNYAVSVDPTSAKMTQNEATTATVSVLGRSTSPVALSVSGCPPNTTCTFSPARGSPNFASTFRIATSPTAPNGNYDMVIAATNSTQSKTVPFHLTISNRLLLSYQRGDGGAFSEVQDTHIYNATPNVNFGTADTLLVDGRDCVGTAPLSVCKTLIKFPLIIGPSAGQIARGSTIGNATLELNIKNKGVTEDLYQVTEAWTESGATWNSFATPGIPGNRGKEFTLFPTTLGKILINVTSIVQRWANGEVNQGILLASTNPDGVDYDSSESIGGPRPLLRVEFVPPPPSFDFSVSVSPSSGFVQPGGSVSATAAATLVSGATRNVQYTCTNLPSGATCTFTPPTCSPTCTANLLLSTSSSTLAGRYTVSVQATNGTTTRTSGFALTVGGLVLNYDMENLTADGRMKDLSGNGRNGTITGTVDVAGKVGRARDFDPNAPSNAKISTPSISLDLSTGAFTFAAWVKPTRAGPDPAYASWGVIWKSSDIGFSIVEVSPTIWGVKPWIGGYAYVHGAFNFDEWHHVAVVYAGNGSSSRNVYVDATFVATDTTGTAADFTGVLTVGDRGGYTTTSRGTIDEVRVYNRVLTASEIAAFVPRPPPSQAPILFYDMENLTADGRMKDLSGNEYHGTIVGTTAVAGKVGMARAFDPNAPSNDKISTPSIPLALSSGAFTFAAWVKPTRVTPNPAYASWVVVSKFPYIGFSIVEVTPTKWAVKAWVGGNANLIGAFNFDEWHHVAVIYVGNGSSSRSVYVDGIFVATDTTGTAKDFTGVLTVGDRGGYTTTSRGTIDEVRVYNRVLTASEIAALASGVPPLFLFRSPAEPGQRREEPLASIHVTVDEWRLLPLGRSNGSVERDGHIPSQSAAHCAGFEPRFVAGSFARLSRSRSR